MWAPGRLVVNAWRPVPYRSGPGMPSGNRPLVRARRSGHSLAPASTRRPPASGTMPDGTRRPRPAGATHGRSAPQASTATVSPTVVPPMSVPVRRFGSAPRPPSLPVRRAVPSLSVRHGGMLELASVLRVVRSSGTATRTPGGRKRALTGAGVSAPAPPFRLIASNRARQPSSRARSEAAFTVGTAPPPPP